MYYIRKKGKIIGILQENRDNIFLALLNKHSKIVTAGRILLNKKDAGESGTHFIPVLSEPFEVVVVQRGEEVLSKEVTTTAYRLAAESEGVAIFEDVTLSYNETETDNKRSIQA